MHGLSVSTDLIVVGHLAIDNIYRDEKFLGRFLGGSPTYVSSTAAKLGVKVSVLSKVGRDFGKEYIEALTESNVDLSFLKRIKDAETTKFVLRYSARWKRQLRLEVVAPSIRLRDLPEGLKAKAAHIAPIANEVEVEVIQRLREISKILSIDPQGFVRRFDRNGNVRLKTWEKPRIIGLFDVYKSSFDEVKAITKASGLDKAMKRINSFGVKVVLVTLGAQGSAMYFEKRSYRIPAAPSKRVIDVTGAGDAYIGGFLAEYIRGKDVLWCACVGSAAASFVVEEFGSSSFGEKKAVYERASEVYEKVRRKRN